MWRGIPSFFVTLLLLLLLLLLRLLVASSSFLFLFFAINRLDMKHLFCLFTSKLSTQYVFV